ncbi:hybrid sensor histidine kinase/response regulator [Azoarcus sp. KH32C]|uniref:hybrid sensor histidine kinase/response regulator n=1 Tax=Azoarcus sp. KH32C TaxID=748247 RepID=UPI0002385B95|nr:hybrid sensor histidine kinase/response regulator [Azoarcus sp. KH32C]BAL27272.1 CheA signal transduction histidine kinase [Azoarcus sp. KH32C]
MSAASERDLSQLSMLELFRLDAEMQVQALTDGLLALGADAVAAAPLEACMRAAHSLKGAARMVELDAGVAVANAMEDCFVAAQRGGLQLGQPEIDILLRGVDLIVRVTQTPEAEIDVWSGGARAEVTELVAALSTLVAGRSNAAVARVETAVVQSVEAEATEAGGAEIAAVPPEPPAALRPEPGAAAIAHDAPARVLRVGADNLNRLLGLASESLVESRALAPFSTALLRLKRLQGEACKALDSLHERFIDAAAGTARDDSGIALVAAAREQLGVCQAFLTERLAEMELADSRSTQLAHRLYDAALACRMRPFADGLRGYPRLVRDLGRTLGKLVRLEIEGGATPVDREILERLDAPLGHLLRNAVDHGIEPAAARRAAGKPEEGLVRLAARHSAGRLHIVVADDGGGIDQDRLRRTVVERRLANAEMAAELSETELLEFLFLPGFSLKEEVSDVSGRGVGLDAVRDTIRELRGHLRLNSTVGEGTRFQLELPLTLSVVRALLVDIGGEPYAFPLAHIACTLKLSSAQVEQLEGRQHFSLAGRRIGLVAARQLFGGETGPLHETLSVVVVGEGAHAYGLVTDGFLGERELVVQPLDPRLGKVEGIAAGALMEDGAPLLIVDVEDLLRTLDKLVAGGRVGRLAEEAQGARTRRRRVLVVDDSLTVRELERKLLDRAGYEVEAAVDGMDGWNTVRSGHFDLVVTDIDMPRLDGIELVSLIRKDPHLKSLPVMVVSYKDREEDRRRGLDAGADYYLAKGSFHDEGLLQAVADLIGEGR